MTNSKMIDKLADLQKTLRIDCEKCCGLCCVALYCIKTDGFPENKAAGVPCRHLRSDFRCDIHDRLTAKKMKGCLAYDCFGAGQKVTQKAGENGTWKTHPEKAKETFQVFTVVFQLHQMAWYLLEALALSSDQKQQTEITALIVENEQLTAAAPDQILSINVAAYREKVNHILKQVSHQVAVMPDDKKATKDLFGKNLSGENFDGQDFSMALMIATNLEGASLRGTNFLGADLRDANINNTNLSKSLFLTQMQINATRGNVKTKLPKNLVRPSHW